MSQVSQLKNKNTKTRTDYKNLWAKKLNTFTIKFVVDTPMLLMGMIALNYYFVYIILY